MERVRCATCGLINFATEHACLRCGRSLDSAPAERSSWDPPAVQPPPTPESFDTRPLDDPGPRFQDTASAGIWDPRARHDAPAALPPRPPPPSYGSPPYVGNVGFARPEDQAAALIAKAIRDSRNALIAALVGLVTFCCFGGLFLGIFAIVKGNESRRVLEYYNVEQGRNMALAATVVGALDIAVTLVFLVANFASSILR